MRPQVGQLFQNKYRLLRLIGDGGMGSVYEARHELLGTTVALKFLHPELGRRPGLVQRFLQEARVSAQIQSPHVVRVIDVDQSAEGLAYIVLEYLEGGTLQGLYEDLYKAGQRLSFSDALGYAMQILEGVEAAHRTGVVHRDLKPDNVMITRDAKGAPLVKLLDFGIAKLKVTGQLERGLTRPGVIMGTPEYMAPEQAYSADAVDARADIFSLGVMIFEMLAGRRPVGGDEPQQIAGAYLAGNVAKLTDLVPGIAPELAAAIHRAMAPLAKDRFDSVAELRAALEPFAPRSSLVSGAGISAPAITPAVSAASPPPATHVGHGDGRASSVPKTIPPDEPADASGVVASALGSRGSSESAEGAQAAGHLVSAAPSASPHAGSFGPPGTPGAFVAPLLGVDPHAGVSGGASAPPQSPQATDLSGGPLPQSLGLPGTMEAAPLRASGTALGPSAGAGGTAFGNFVPPGPGVSPTQGTAPMDPYASNAGIAHASYPSPVARPRKRSRTGSVIGMLALAGAVAGITVGAVWGLQQYRSASSRSDDADLPLTAPTVIPSTPAGTAAAPDEPPVATPPVATPPATTPPVPAPPAPSPPVATAKPPTQPTPKPPTAGTVIMLPTALPTLPGIGQIPVPPWANPQQPAPQPNPQQPAPQPKPSGTTPGRRPYVPILPGGGGRREAPDPGSPGGRTNDGAEERPRIPPRPMLGLPVERSKSDAGRPPRPARPGLRRYLGPER